MSELHIVSIKQSKADQECLEVELEINPTSWQRILGKNNARQTYIGYFGSWSIKGCYSLAPKMIAEFLDHVCRSHEYRHLILTAKKAS